MKLYLKFLICSFLLLLGWNLSHAQVTGFQGRRLQVKTDLMSYLLDGGYNVGIEAALLRRLSIGVGYRTFNRAVRQPVINNGSTNAYPDATQVYGFIYPEKADIRGEEYMFTGKLYVRSAFCAPKGVYLFGYYGRGRAEVEGEFTREGIDPFTGNEGHILKSFHAKNVRTSKQGIGLGNQWVFYSRFTLDVSGALEYNFLGTRIGDEVDWYLQSVNETYGASLLNESDFSVSAFSETRGNGGSGIWGVSATVQVGVLLF